MVIFILKFEKFFIIDYKKKSPKSTSDGYQLSAEHGIPLYTSNFLKETWSKSSKVKMSIKPIFGLKIVNSRWKDKEGFL